MSLWPRPAGFSSLPINLIATQKNQPSPAVSECRDLIQRYWQVTALGEVSGTQPQHGRCCLNTSAG